MLGRAVIVVLLFVLAGCETAPIRSSHDIPIKTSLSTTLTLPADFPVAYHVSYEEQISALIFPDLNRTYYKSIGKNFNDALGLIMPSMFSNASALDTQTQFKYLFKYNSEPEYDNMFGTFTVNLQTVVLDNEGSKVFETTNKGKATGSGFSDPNALAKAYAIALKDSAVQFLNHIEQAQPYGQGFNKNSLKEPKDLRIFFPELEPAGTGTGFYIDQEGSVVTAAHVTSGCLYIDVQHKGTQNTSTIRAQSKLLDIAVLDTHVSSEYFTGINDEKLSPKLGESVFVTGYPLSGVLSNFPSLTLGNISSLGGLKGAKGYFQFSAPIQPGNSGGPVVDYQGNLAGIVTSTLNQTMMLSNTGTTSQNVNFGINTSMLKKFLDKNEINYVPPKPVSDFENASKNATEYTVQVMCYK